MVRNGILSVGFMLLACLTVRAEDNPALESLKAENEQLRRERDTLQSRLRIVQDQLDESRKSNTAARLEIELLEFRCKKLQDEMKQAKTEQPPIRVLPEADPPADVAKSKVVRGRITSISTDFRLMQISVGIEAGVKDGQVLDVYRVSTEKGKQIPLYLGTVRVMRADPQAALGHFERVPGLDRVPKVGDEVSNELTVK